MNYLEIGQAFLYVGIAIVTIKVWDFLYYKAKTKWGKQ